MGLAEWFKDLCNNLQVNDGGTISARYKRITKQLNKDFWDITSDTSHSLYVGSYGRNTAIDGFSDLDMIFELPSELYYQYNAYTGNGQSALLQAVRLSVENIYRAKADGQVVIIEFDDGITFELNPVFPDRIDSYIFPDSNNGGSWRITNPKPEIQAIRERNTSCNNNLVPLCRMMRAWKYKWDVPIGGLLIDTLAYQFIENYEHRARSYLYYDFICRDFFKWMADQDVEQEYWRAPGSGQSVYGKGLFQYKAKRCYNISLAAIENEMAKPKRELSAKKNWREIFGTKFPE